MFKLFKKKEIIESETDKGLYKDNNEDSKTTLLHPLSNEIKLLAVADGVGGNAKGEVASNFVIKELEKWFISEDLKTFNSSMLLSKKLYNIIQKINKELYDTEYNKSKCGTTLTCAVVGFKTTIIANIGDSRAYAVTNDDIKQLTKDDSIVWEYYEHGEITKDEIRFHIFNNIITKCIGHHEDCKPTILKVNNDSYTGLLLVTDGVTDCLSDEKIKFLVVKKHHRNIVKQIINEAVYQQQRNIIREDLLLQDVPNGKDNATAVLYLKPKYN